MKDRVSLIRRKLNLTAKDFGNRLCVAQSTISSIETGIRQPSNQLINSICREFNVNETWLRTGEGEMFNELSKEEQVTRFVAKLLRSPDAAFQRALIVALSELPPEAWEIWADFVLSLGEEYKKQKGQPPDGS